MVDGSIDERNHAPEPGGEPLRTEVPTEELHQLLGGHWCELPDANFVGTHDPTLRETLHQAKRVQLFIADHVCDNVFHRPPVAKARRVPFLWCQRFKERGKVGSLVVGHVHQGLLSGAHRNASAVAIST